MLSLAAVVLAILFSFEFEGSWDRQARKMVCHKLHGFDPSGRCDEVLRPRPHILFVLAPVGFDDVDLSCVEADCKTPNLASLATDGVRFSRYYGDSSGTPTREAILTGRYAFHILGSGLLTVADHLQAQGNYATHAIGLWQLGEDWPATPLCRGFDSFYGAMTDDSKCCVSMYAEQDRMEATFDASDSCQPSNDRWAAALRGTEQFSNASVHIIHEHNTINEGHAENGRLAEDRLPVFLYLVFKEVAPAADPSGRGSEDLRRLTQQHVGAIDAAVRRTVDALKSHEDMWENTVLVFASTGGGAPSSGSSNWPYRGGAGTLWEGGLRSHALVTAGAKAAQGLNLPSGRQQFSGLAHHTDWLRTLLYIAETPYDEAVDQARFAQAAPPGDWRTLDGFNLWPGIVAMSRPAPTPAATARAPESKVTARDGRASAAATPPASDAVWPRDEIVFRLESTSIAPDAASAIVTADKWKLVSGGAGLPNAWCWQRRLAATHGADAESGTRAACMLASSSKPKGRGHAISSCVITEAASAHAPCLACRGQTCGAAMRWWPHDKHESCDGGSDPAYLVVLPEAMDPSVDGTGTGCCRQCEQEAGCVGWALVSVEQGVGAARAPDSGPTAVASTCGQISLVDASRKESLLFDLETDEWESTNLAKAEAGVDPHPMLAVLRDRLVRRLDSAVHTMPPSQGGQQPLLHAANRSTSCLSTLPTNFAACSGTKCDGEYDGPCHCDPCASCPALAPPPSPSRAEATGAPAAIPPLWWVPLGLLLCCCTSCIVFANAPQARGKRTELRRWLGKLVMPNNDEHLDGSGNTYAMDSPLNFDH
jgi:hypothetical protein